MKIFVASFIFYGLIAMLLIGENKDLLQQSS